MRLFSCLLPICAVLLFTSCVGTRESVPGASPEKNVPEAAGSRRISRPPETGGKLEDVLVGRVVLVNPAARFAVLSFPLGRMPPIDQHLGVFRAGAQVGELKASGPVRDDSIVADILAGNCQAGDEVRDK